MRKIKLNYLGKKKTISNNPEKCLLDSIPNKKYNKNYLKNRSKSKRKKLD